MLRFGTLFLFSCILTCSGDLIINPIFSDGAILQTTEEGGQPPTIFGQSNSLASINVSGTGEFPHFATKADVNGRWSVTITKTPDSGIPYNISIEEYTPNGTIYIDSGGMTDVHFGDVYFCSGQSNMAFSMKGTTNAAEELANAHYTNVRLFKASGARFSLQEPPAFVQANSPWMSCTNVTVAAFSAVCYLAGENIMKMHTKGRYIGLVESAVGGTGIQLWATNETEQTCGQQASRLASHYAPASLYASMVQPYLPFAVRAAFWYQGEANADECCPIAREAYSCYLEHMIRDWRHLWGYTVPFVVIQLHTWGYLPCDAQTVSINGVQSGIRLAEWDVGRHNSNDTFLVTASDQGGPLHPPYKSEVGRRVALAVVANVFKQDVPWLGPSVVNGSANHSATSRNQFEVDLVLENAKGLKMVDTKACNGSKPETCTRYCCKNGAPGLFILEGYNWSSSYSANLHNLMVTDLSDNHVHLSMLKNDTYNGKAHIVRLLYAVGPQPTCSLVNSDGIAMPTLGPVTLALH
eukprot:m.208666 g.208666  ORF g.208666 m.208666 type:complete len:523 (+) comp39713_c0_seq1:43-1611(+)